MPATPTNACPTPGTPGYVTPDDEHDGRGDSIRQARRGGPAAARLARLAARGTGHRTEAP